MKTKLMTLTLVIATTYSIVGSARDSVRDYSDRRPVLTQVKWIGNFRCNEKIHDPKHANGHECDLKFVNDTTGEEWSVKDNPTLQSIHQKYNGVVKAHVEAMSSPRYLLGGSYIEVQRIEALPQANVTEELNTESSGKSVHVCALGNPSSAN